MLNSGLTKLEIHSDERGLLAEVLRESLLKKPIKFIYTTMTHPNCIRAGHYHKEKWEWFFVTFGKARIALEDKRTGEKEMVIMDGNAPSVLELKPYVKHTIEAVGDGDLHLTAVSNKEFDENSQDTYID